MALSFLRLEVLEKAAVFSSPYTHMVADSLVVEEDKRKILQDYPQIKNPGFFPLETLEIQGDFKKLIEELQGPEIAEVLTRKLNIELRDKPRMITIRK
jgi:hypothetical protein